MSRIRVGLLALVVLGLVTASVPAAQIFFTTTDFAGSNPPAIANPTLSLTPGQAGTLYVWVLPGTFSAEDVVQALGLSMTAATSGVLSNFSMTTYDPGVWNEDNEANDYRWQGKNNGTATANGISNANAASVTQGYGLRNISSTSTLTPYANDPLLNRATRAFLHARVDFTAAAQGTTDFNFSVGSDLITRKIDGAFLPVSFGAGESATVSGGTAGATGSIADATITVTPEPATMVLLALGGLGVLARRRRA